MWSMGFIMAGILTGKPLWSGHDRDGLLHSLYKFVGTPAKGNYEGAVRYPYYNKPEKKYINTVQKALLQRLDGRHKEFEHEVDLVGRMLCLEPGNRITAEEALSHDAITEFVKARDVDPTFTGRFANDWIQLKKSLIRKVAEDDFRKTQVALAMAPNLVASQDDLYSMDDLLVSSTSSMPSNKRVKLDKVHA